MTNKFYIINTKRCAEQIWARGGNASNSSTILASIGVNVEYLGTLADDALLRCFDFIRYNSEESVCSASIFSDILRFQQDDMTSLGIKHENCPIIKNCGNGPLSIVVCSKETGSRTIVHAKGNLPELKFDDFAKLNLRDYSWIHFEVWQYESCLYHFCNDSVVE